MKRNLNKPHSSATSDDERRTFIKKLLWCRWLGVGGQCFIPKNGIDNYVLYKFFVASGYVIFISCSIVTHVVGIVYHLKSKDVQIKDCCGHRKYSYHPPCILVKGVVSQSAVSRTKYWTSGVDFKSEQRKLILV